MRALVIGAMLLLTACSTTATGVTASPSRLLPSNSPTAQASASAATSTAYAIIAAPRRNALGLVGLGSQAQVTSVTPPTFQANAVMPWTSASLTRLYYLTSTGEVDYLQPDGATGTATQIALGANEQAGFAVSPNDSRLAVTILKYSVPPGGGYPTYDGMRMYVEDLNGGDHHVNIFSSTSVAEFPIGWVQGRLVVAVSFPLCCQSLRLNPYDASAYHIVDPATGTRLVSLCGNGYDPVGPIEPGGVMCYAVAKPPKFEWWDGRSYPWPAAMPDPTVQLAAVSPGGTQVAVGGSPIYVSRAAGTSTRLGASGYVFGWLDESHVVAAQDFSSELRAVDVTSGQGFHLADDGTYLGTVPAAVS